jgi:hypothetical protein
MGMFQNAFFLFYSYLGFLLASTKIFGNETDLERKANGYGIRKERQRLDERKGGFA